MTGRRRELLFTALFMVLFGVALAVVELAALKFGFA